MRTETDGVKLNFRLPRFLWNTHKAPDKLQMYEQTYEQILQAKLYCEAGRLLIEREERLFGEIQDPEAATGHQEEVTELEVCRRELLVLVLETLRLSLEPVEVGGAAALVSAVKAVEQEEAQDRLWGQRGRTPPAWRPCGWKELHDSTLRGLVEERMDSPSVVPPTNQVGQSSVQADVCDMGRQLKEDLLQVASVVRSCYPPEHNIGHLYIKAYHSTFSARLRKIADFGLEDKDCKFLLRWVNEYYPQVLQKTELAGEMDVAALGKLLPEELLKPLEDQFLSGQQEELTTFVGRILEDAKDKWNKGEEPSREDGFFVSPVSYDIIQLINGKVTSAEKVVGDLQKARTIPRQLNDLMQRFKGFQNDVIKQNKTSSRPVVKAHLGCIQQFRDFLNMKRHLFTEEVWDDCLHVLTDMKLSAQEYLLKPVHEVLKPEYRKLGTSDWLNKNLFISLLHGLEEELQGLQGSIGSCHQELLRKLHQEVTVEYVRRLLKGAKLKDEGQQVKACNTVRDNAESLHELFVKMGSDDVWLKDILTKIAEVLRLQNLPAIQLQVASLGTDYPDLSEKHVSALLKLKTNLSKADRRSVTDVLSVISGSGGREAAPTFFSEVRVK
ncbi:tumor necrosis factor alpha-induced protein 2-like [Pungitius pungitius]|uniref:tumor necrosis factor alpha-induced protein 2-like n=1 Tax=Pungitius pungitius TaxID=134920 RepID=UPI002E0FA0DA